MTNPLIVQLKIKETATNKKIQEIKIKIARLMNELSVYVGTYYGDFEEIDAEKIKQIGDELVAAKNEVTDLTQKLKNIQKELN
ncbi:MAG: hypothetical protein ACI37T_07470 [Candidatus Gastranaerophilaceae bacterium]